MPATYTTNLLIEKPEAGTQQGIWGTTVNINFDIYDRALGGSGVIVLGAAGSSGAPNVTEIAEAALSDAHNYYVSVTDAGDLGATAFLRLDPNTSERIIYIENNLSNGRDLTVFQGTYNASNDLVVAPGTTVLARFDGGGAGGTVTDLNSTFLKSGQAINGTPIGTTTPDVGEFSGLTVGNVSFPATDGDIGQVLTTDGSGNVTFQDVASSAEADTLDSVTDRGASTANAITVGAITISGAGTAQTPDNFENSTRLATTEWVRSVLNRGQYLERVITTASDAAANEYFGVSCALSSDGSIMAVGAFGWDGAGGANQGVVYVYDWNGSAWVERASVVTASDAGAGDYFGYSCALSSDGTVLAVGAQAWDGAAGTDQGAVYVFDWNGSAWVERTTALTASDAGASDQFGTGCALSSDGSIMAVGAPSWTGAGGSGQGAVYIYDWNGSAWVERTTALTASDAGASDSFGFSCALSSDGTVLAVGTPLWNGVSGNLQGAVYIYDWNGSAWVERTTALTPSDAGGLDQFGQYCALSSDGSIMAVSAPLWDGPAGSQQGAIYIYDWNGSAWVERATALTPSDAGGSDEFGSGCALSSDGAVLAVAAQAWDGAAGTDQGAVYTFFQVYK